MCVNYRIQCPGLLHIIEHHGACRKDVYTKLFQVLWYGNKVGSPALGRNTPTYVFPQDIVTCIRRRFPDAGAGKYDTQYSDGNETNVYNVTWSDVAGVKWPTPPKSCTKCGPKTAKKPY